MKTFGKTAIMIVFFTVYALVGWIVGLGLFALALVRGLVVLVRARRALAPTTNCPWCQAVVEQYGPYSCASCHARTLGWAWRCGACGAWAGHIECASCSMSVPNPLLPRP